MLQVLYVALAPNFRGPLKPRITNLHFVDLQYRKDMFPIQHAKSEIRELFGCSQDSRDTRWSNVAIVPLLTLVIFMLVVAWREDYMTAGIT